MNRRTILPERLARWSLFLAAVLQFGAAVAGPYWHLSVFPVAAAEVVEPRQEDGSGVPVGQHDEQTCLVCQSAASVGVLPASTVVAFAAATAVLDPPEAATFHLRDSPSGTRARAPPLA